MQTFSLMQKLTTHFERSRNFFYLVIDLFGNCRYVNPYLKEMLMTDTVHLEQLPVTDLFVENDRQVFKLACESCLHHQQTVEAEVFMIAKQNGLVHTKWEISTITDSEGKIDSIQAIGFIYESPELVARINQLQDSELFYRNLIAESLDGIVLSDVSGVIDFASPSIANILGYELEDVLGKTLFYFAHPEDHGLASLTFQEEVKERPNVKFINIRLRKKDGEYLWAIVRGHNMLHNPYVRRMVIYFSDDTMRKEAEDALLQSQDSFKRQATILNSVTDVIITTDMDRRVTSWNTVIENLSGISAVNAIGKKLTEVIDKDYSPYTHDQVIEIVKSEGIWRGEISFSGSNNEKVYLLHTVSMLYSSSREDIGMLGIGKVITERKKADQQIRKSELFYRRLSYYSIDGVLMSDQSGQITYCGPSVERISGYEPADLLGHNFFEFVHPDDVPLAREAFIIELKKESVLNYLFLRLKHSNGEWVWCTVRGHNLLDNPDINAFIIYFTNDSKRKQAEDQLRKSEENFRSLITNLKQGVILSDNNGVTTICNQAALEMLGIEEKDIIGKNSLKYFHDIIREDGTVFSGPVHPISAILNTDKPIRDVVIGLLHKNSSERVWLLVNAEPIFTGDENLDSVVCSLTDITEQKRLSDELFEQEINKQRLLVQATIDGQEKERQEMGKELHDNINQYLTTARLYMEVAKEKSDGEVKEMINLSHKTLSDIVKEIRKISQSLIPPTLGDIGLVESIQELCDSIRQAHPMHIEVHYQYFDDSALTDNYKLMFYRIVQEQLNNILKHSGAMKMSINLQSDAESVVLIIQDNGKGFDKMNYKRGRGLSNISSRASLMNGNMDIQTSPENGCSIIISIPVSGSGN